MSKKLKALVGLPGGIIETLDEDFDEDMVMQEHLYSNINKEEDCSCGYDRNENLVSDDLDDDMA